MSPGSPPPGGKSDRARGEKHGISRLQIGGRSWVEWRRVTEIPHAAEPVLEEQRCAHVGREFGAREQSGCLFFSVARRLLDLEDDLAGLIFAVVAAHPCGAGLHESHRFVSNRCGRPVAKAMHTGIYLPSHRWERVLEGGGDLRRKPEI